MTHHAFSHHFTHGHVRKHVEIHLQLITCFLCCGIAIDSGNFFQGFGLSYIEGIEQIGNFWILLPNIVCGLCAQGNRKEANRNPQCRND